MKPELLLLITRLSMLAFGGVLGVFGKIEGCLVIFSLLMLTYWLEAKLK